MALRLALICHAPTLATRTASFPNDESLDGPGFAKARAVPRHFGEAARCWTSPALAARQTADALGLSAEIAPELRECDYGAWAGRSLDAVQCDDPAEAARWLSEPAAAPHGGESLLRVMQRSAAWLDARSESSGKALAVTHVSVVRSAIIRVLDASPHAFWRIDLSPLSVTWLRCSQRQWTLVAVNQKLLHPQAPLAFETIDWCT